MAVSVESLIKSKLQSLGNSIETRKHGDLRILFDPQQREQFLEIMLAIDGLSHIQEDPLAAYCPISLTSTPTELKLILKERQRILMDDVLSVSGITAYDPASAPFSPDVNLTAQPNEVYVVDSGKIAGARYFVGHNLLPSSGQGIEAEKAIKLMRIPVVLMDKNIRVSRMQPHRTIYLQYSDFEQQAEEFTQVFLLLKQYEPGIGFHGNLPVLLGFSSEGEIVDLEETVYGAFPKLQYHYDGKVPILTLRAENPELSTNKQDKHSI